MSTYHQLLQHQIKRYLPGNGALEPWQSFLTAVNETYFQRDEQIRRAHTRNHSKQGNDQAQSEMRAVFEQLINSSNHGIFAFDRDYQFIAWNPAIERIANMTKAQVLGQSAFAINPSLFGSRAGELFQQTLEGKTLTSDIPLYEFVPYADNRGFYETQFSPLLDETGVIIGGLGVISDITQRKQMEELQRQQQEYLIVLQETALRLNNHSELDKLLADITSRATAMLANPHTFVALVSEQGAITIHIGHGIFQRYVGQTLTDITATFAQITQIRKGLIDMIHPLSDGTPHIWTIEPLFSGMRVAGLFGVAKALDPRQGVHAFTVEETNQIKQFAQLMSIALSHAALLDVNARLASLATTDPLTGLPNHRSVMDAIERMVSSSRETQSESLLLFIDIDHFKRINDTWGHQAGDMILREVAQVLRHGLRPDDFVGRYGGEEFAIVLPHTSLAIGRPIAERICRTLARHLYHWEDEHQAETAIPVTASIGVATFPTHGAVREALINAADKAMYDAKQQGRNRVRYSGSETSPSLISPPLIAAPHAQVVEALIAVSSARDLETEEHARRIEALAVGLGQRVGFSEEDLRSLRIAARLHDIGKVGIPDTILYKAGPLTDEEWAIVRQHPEIGCDILSQLGESLIFVAQMILSHHERWDGTGYPAKRKGDQIPLAARVLALADSFDAMISDRPYSQAMSRDEALAELQRHAGTQFDPHLVTIFVEMLTHSEGDTLAA